MLADGPRFYMQEIVASSLNEWAQEKDTYRKPPLGPNEKIGLKPITLQWSPMVDKTLPQHTIYKHISF